MALSGLSWEMIVASVCTLRENCDFATTVLIVSQRLET
jgi:hypothetical protein